MFGEKKLAIGEALILNTILFDAGKADLKPESKPEPKARVGRNQP